MKIPCPCCNQPMDVAETPEFLKYISCGAVSQKILIALVDAYPRGLTKAKLIHAAYSGDIDGGPDLANDTINQIIYRIRLSLKKYGWAIPPVRPGPSGDANGYRLERIGAISGDGGNHE